MSDARGPEIDVFLSSRLPSCRDHVLWKLRRDVVNCAGRVGLIVWQPQTKPPNTAPEDILEECLLHLSKADLYICILEDTYGTNQEDLGDLSILELEIFCAVFTRKITYVFAIKPFNPSEELRSFLDALEVMYPGVLQRCSREEALRRTKRILWLHRLVPRSLRKLIRGPVPYGLWSRNRGTNFSSGFLDGRFAPFGYGETPKKERINRLLEKAVKIQHQPTKLVFLWTAIRHLSMAPYDDPQFAKFLPLWNRALALWAGAAAWGGFHGQHLSVGRLSAVNTLLALRKHATKCHVTLGGQVYGAIASEYYSLAKRVHSRERRRALLQAALEQVELGLKDNPSDPSGLLLIQGSILLALSRVDDAVTAYEAGLAHRERSGASPGALGEANAELGFGYLQQGKKERARVHLEKGVLMLKQSKKNAGFTVRAIRKLAMYYSRTWQPQAALLQMHEACELALANGLYGQISKPMFLCWWIWNHFYRKNSIDTRR